MTISVWVIIAVLGLLGLAFVRELLVTYFIRNKQQDDTVKVIATMAAKIDSIEHLLNHNTERMIADMPKSNEIDKIILETRASLKASRAYLLQFHNGSNFSTSSPVWKFSLTHETTDSATKSIAECSKDILVSNVLPFINPLFDSNNLCDGITKITPNEEDELFNVFKLSTNDLTHSTLRGFMLSRGISNLFFAPVLDGSNLPIGVLCIDYSNNTPPIYATEEYIYRKLFAFSSILTAHLIQNGAHN